MPTVLGLRRFDCFALFLGTPVPNLPSHWLRLRTLPTATSAFLLIELKVPTWKLRYVGSAPGYSRSEELSLKLSVYRLQSEDAPEDSGIRLLPYRVENTATHVTFCTHSGSIKMQRAPRSISWSVALCRCKSRKASPPRASVGHRV